MGAYEFNKSTYKPLTLRLNRVKDSDVIRHLDDLKSVNAYIVDLIRRDMKKNPEPGAYMYEVLEDMGTRKDVLKGFNSLSEAVEFLYMYVSSFDYIGKVYIAQRFSGILPDGHKVKCGKVVNIDIEKEEKE